MQKTAIASLLIFLTALSGITYHFMNNSNLPKQSLRFVATDDVQAAWITWQAQYGKIYKDAEAPLRYNVFQTNYQYIQTHNSDTAKSFKLGLNQFADYTNQEFAALQAGSLLKGFKSEPTTLAADGLPTTVDWRSSGAVTDVKNQGQCGSCWAFSSSGALEGLNAISGNTLTSFAPQQLVDCAGPVVQTQGCNGGLPTLAFQYTAKYGIESWTDYAYTGVQGTCAYSKDKVVFQNSNYQAVTANDPSQLKAAASKQPVSVGIEADTQDFQLYSSGTYNSAACGTNVDHAVLVVGYGTDTNGTSFWIVKNSWGTTWGQQGYIMIANQSGDGICGINTMPSYPTA